MPVFTIEIETVVKRISEIVVEADDLESAVVYAKTNNEWRHETDNRLNDIQSYVTCTPVSGRQIKSITDLPKNYNKDTVPWNTSTHASFEDIFRQYPEILDKRIEDVFTLSVRSAAALKNANIDYIGQLVLMTEREIFNIKNFGRKSAHKLKMMLSDKDLCFGMRFDWPI